MASKRKGRGPLGSEAEDFVPAVVARNPEEAEEYRELLNDHDIPAILHTDDEEPPAKAGRTRPAGGKIVSRGVAVLVPEALLDEASEIIADRDYDDIKIGEDPDGEDEDEEDEMGLEVMPDIPGPEGRKSGRPAGPKDKANPFDIDDDAFELDDEEDEKLVGGGEGLAGDEDEREEDKDEEGE